MKLRQTIWTLGLALLLCTSAAIAQDQKQDQSPIDPNAPLQPLDTTPYQGNSNRPPVAAARGVNSSNSYNQTYDPSQVTPDTNTLAGAAPFTLGSLQHNVNIFDPAITVSQVGQAVPGTSGKTVITGISIASASLNFNRSWSAYHFTTLYNGGETFNLGYNRAPTFFGSTAPNYQFHNLAISQEADWARWHVLIRDNFASAPGASFTGQGMGGPGLAAQFSSTQGTSMNSFAQSFVPTENINTGSVMSYMNSVLGQAEYSFSRRSAVTFAASYGLLRFQGSGFVDSSMLDAQVGYDYLLDPSNSIALLVNYGKIEYIGTGISTVDYVGALAYGRKITGRLAFQIAAGPQEIQSVLPGSSGNFHLLEVSVNSALTYQRRRNGVSLDFVRGLNGGSGVFLGAMSSTASFADSYQFTRRWTSTVNGGYALNNSLAAAGVKTTQFDNWFVGANLGRQVGRHAAINFNYGATRQNNPATCTVALCGGNGLQQSVGISVNWHVRPIGYEGR